MKNLDNLEQFINDNRADFDDAVPSLKAWAEIDKAISSQKAKVITLRKVLAIAASVVILLVAGASFGAFMSNGSNDNLTAQLSEIAPDFVEAEQYYQQKIDRKYQQLASYSHDQTIEEDLSQLDELMNELKAELIVAPKGKEEEIVESLIESYQTKISILERVLDRIQSTQPQQNSKPKDNEISI
jgi:hypothetical protein